MGLPVLFDLIIPKHEVRMKPKVGNREKLMAVKISFDASKNAMKEGVRERG